MQTIEHIIPDHTYTHMEALLREGKLVEDEGRDDVIWKTTVSLDGGYEVDFKICNSEDGPYLDIVTFLGGTEVGCSIGDSLSGIYELSDIPGGALITIVPSSIS